MLALDQAARHRDAGGHPLPVAWPTLRTQGVEIRGSELTVVAGQPAAGKSAFALATAIRTGVRTLYFCADTAAWTMAVRAIAMISGVGQDVIEQRLQEDSTYGQGAFDDLRHIRWCFDSAPTLDDIDNEVAAYAEVWGDDPELIVIDNLIDVSDGDDEWGAIRRTQKELKYLARETGAAVFVLHHVTEAFKVEEGAAPSRSAILGKDTRLPALVMTVTNEDGYMGVAVVKNRYGKCDPSGRSPQWFTFDGSRMQIQEIQS